VENAQVAADVSGFSQDDEGIGVFAARRRFLGYTNLGLTTLIQYWRSFDHLERYARASDRHHWPAWLDFNRRMKNSRGDVGIWHETYIVPAGAYESVYSGMPLIGLAKAGR
jgi:hypothetical protein